MNFRTLLWKHHVKKDGKCDIKIYCSHNNTKKYFSIGFGVKPEHFDDLKQKVKKNHPLAGHYNAKIRQLQLDIEQHILNGGQLKSFNLKVDPIQYSLIEFMKKFMGEIERGLHSIQLSSLKNYKATFNRLSLYMEYSGLKDIAFEDITLDFYFSFVDFLTKKANCGLMGIGKHIKILKKIMNESYERDLHQNLNHRHPKFKRHKNTSSDKIFLTEKEIKQIEELDLSGTPSLQVEQHRFLISYYFILRYSDSVRIRKKHFFEREGRTYLKIISQKTKMESIVPVNPKALKLLESNDFDLSGDTNQEANRKIKQIVVMAGINEVVEQDGLQKPKSMFVTTHTARRSAATNLYLNKV